MGGGLTPRPQETTVRRLLKRIDALLLTVASLFLAGFLVSVLLQVFFRYVLEHSLPWTEEFGVYLFVWSSFMAAAVVVGMNDHFSIPLLVDGLRGRRRWILEVISTFLCILFGLVMVWKGAAWSWRMLSAYSPVLQLPQGAVYLIIPVSGLCMIAHLMARLVVLLDGRSDTDERPSC